MSIYSRQVAHFRRFPDQARSLIELRKATPSHMLSTPERIELDAAHAALTPQEWDTNKRAFCGD